MGYVDEDNPWAAQLAPTGCADCQRILWHRSPEQAYSIAPADGGGWEQWGVALLRLFERIGHQPTQAVIITQESFTQRRAGDARPWHRSRRGQQQRVPRG
jgi:hypothetical protein